MLATSPTLGAAAAAPAMRPSRHTPSPTPDNSVFALNPAAQVHIETLSSGCPVVVIDDFYANPLAVRALALAGNYDSSLAYYPGLHRAALTRP